MPEVAWTFKGGRLPDPRRFKTDIIRGMTSLTMAKVKREDSGNYECQLENDHGKCQVTIKVLVIGKFFSQFSYRRSSAIMSWAFNHELGVEGVVLTPSATTAPLVHQSRHMHITHFLHCLCSFHWGENCCCFYENNANYLRILIPDDLK